MSFQVAPEKREYVPRSEIEEAAIKWVESMGSANRAQLRCNLQNVQPACDAMFALRSALNKVE